MMDKVLEKERTDILEVEGDKYVVSYENDIQEGTVRARVVGYEGGDKHLLENEFERDNLGDTYSLPEEIAEVNEAAIEYLEEEILEEDEEDQWAMEGVQSL